MGHFPRAPKVRNINALLRISGFAQTLSELQACCAPEKKRVNHWVGPPCWLTVRRKGEDRQWGGGPIHVNVEFADLLRRTGRE